MYMKFSRGGMRKTLTAAAATLLMSATLATAADEATPDPALSGWLGREITIETSTFNDHIPVGGKLTFVFDSGDNVVRICTRTGPGQRGAWKLDFAVPCGITLIFTAGQRYCTVEDVKAGNAEVLSACHRLRSHDVAMHPAASKGSLALHDMIVFLIEGEGQDKGKHVIQILVDSPARVTDGGGAGGKD